MSRCFALIAGLAATVLAATPANARVAVVPVVARPAPVSVAISRPAPVPVARPVSAPRSNTQSMSAGTLTPLFLIPMLTANGNHRCKDGYALKSFTAPDGKLKKTCKRVAN